MPQAGQLRHAAPVRHVGAEKDDLDRVGTVDGEEEDDDKHSPLIDTDVADVLVQIALGHHNIEPTMLPVAAACCRSSVATSYIVTAAWSGLVSNTK